MEHVRLLTNNDLIKHGAAAVSSKKTSTGSVPQIFRQLYMLAHVCTKNLLLFNFVFAFELNSVTREFSGA